MKKTFLLLLTLSFLASCGDEENVDYSDRGKADTATNSAVSSNDPLLIEINDLQAKVNSDTTFDRTKAIRLFRAYQEFYNAHPKDTVAGNYLFEAANLAQKMDKHQRAIELFITFHDGFPGSHRCDDAVYNVAYIYDAKLNDKQKATEYYKKVIELYPQSMWAEQARGALLLVNMSDEELLKFLKEKNS